MTEWIPLLQSLGVPAVILLAIFYGAWKASAWLGPNVLKPVAEAHITFLHETNDTQAHLAIVLDKISEDMQKQTSISAKQVEIVAVSGSHIEKIHSLMLLWETQCARTTNELRVVGTMASNDLKAVAIDAARELKAVAIDAARELKESVKNGGGEVENA